MNDRFHNSSDATQAARMGAIVTPSNTAPIQSRQLLITSDGVLSVVFAGYEETPTLDDAVTFDVVAGQMFDWAVRYVTEDTTAGVIAVY